MYLTIRPISPRNLGFYENVTISVASFGDLHCALAGACQLLLRDAVLFSSFQFNKFFFAVSGVPGTRLGSSFFV